MKSIIKMTENAFKKDKKIELEIWKEFVRWAEQLNYEVGILSCDGRILDIETKHEAIEDEISRRRRIIRKI